MRKFELGDIIAEREFTLRMKEGSARHLTVRLGRPVEDPENPGDWLCPYQIAGPERVRTLAIFGVDALQALVLALHTLPAEVAALARQLEAEVLHFGEPDTTFLSACRTVLQSAGDAFPRGSTESLTEGDSVAELDPDPTKKSSP